MKYHTTSDILIIKEERIDFYGCGIERRISESFRRTEKRSLRACNGRIGTGKIGINSG